MRAKAEKCDAIDRIREASAKLLEVFGGTDADNPAIIFSRPAVANSDMTRHGSMVAFAVALNQPDASDPIAGILKQEQAADTSLTELIEGHINRAAS